MRKINNNRSNAIESLEPLVLMSASTIEGTENSDWISATEADDLIFAGAGDDWIHAPLGSNEIDGGQGTDTLVVYEGTSAEHTIELQRDGSVRLSGYGLNGQFNVNELKDVEQILFNDVLIKTADLVLTNKAPLSAADEFSTGQDKFLYGNVLANDTDPDGDALTAALVRDPAHGTVVLSADGEFAYIPSPGFSGRDDFEYTVIDAFGAVSRSTVTINVIAPTEAVSAGPTAVDDSFEMPGDNRLFGNVSVNDFDSDGPDYLLSYQLIDDVAKGEINFYADGSFDYVPLPDQTGTDSFRYSVTDGSGETAFGVATIELLTLPEPTPQPPAPEPQVPVPVTVPEKLPVNLLVPRPANDAAPEAEADIFATLPGRTLVDELLLNDRDADGDTLVIVESTTARYGDVTVSAGGAFQYRAEAGFSGIDYFQYAVSDGDQTDWATVVVHVNSDGKLPAGLADLVDTKMVVSPIVFDLNGDGVINVTGETTARDKSSITAVGDTVRFDIDADGTLDTIEWIDGSGDAFLVDVSAIQGTTMNGQALFGDEGGRYENGYVKLADLDADGNRLLEGGELRNLQLWVDNGDGILQSGELQSLQQHDIFSISTTMTLTADGLMRSRAFLTNDWMMMTEDVWFAEADQEWEENPPPDDNPKDNTAPDADPDVLSGRKGQTIRGNVLSNDSDRDGDLLRVLRHTQPVHGNLQFSDDGRFTYTPDADFVGTDYFQYLVSDGRGGTDMAVVMLNMLDDATGAGGATSNAVGHTISGTVWQDWTSAGAVSNANGVREEIESVRGTSVFVSLLDGNGNVINSVHTDGSGSYVFDGLQNGDYQIRVAESSLPGRDVLQAVLTVNDVNGNFFDAIDSDVDRSTGLSGRIVLGQPEGDDETVTVDIGYTYV